MTRALAALLEAIARLPASIRAAIADVFRRRG